MKIMSLNVNRFQAKHYMSGSWAMAILQIVKEFLEKHSDGLVFLYEMPADFDKNVLEAILSPYKVLYPRKIGRCLYSAAIMREEKKWSKIPDEDRFVAGYDKNRKENYANRHIELINDKTGIRVLGVHAPLEDKKDKNKDNWEMIGGEKVYKPVKEFFDKLKEYAERHKKEKFIILGDLNVHSGEECYYLNKYKEIKEMQYFDAIPDGTVTYFPTGNTLDHVLVSHELEGKVTTRVEQDIILSDHAVIIVDIKE